MTTVAPQEVGHLIGGQWVGSGTAERYNPAHPAELVSVTAVGDVSTVEAAVASAKAAQPEWSSRTGPARAAVLTRAAELLTARADHVAVDLVREEGKTLTEATGEVQRAVEVLRFFGAACWRADGETLPSATPFTTVYTRREPLGVVGVITPWNFPIAIPSWKIAPALAAGNAVVAKPAQLTTLSTRHLAHCLTEAGLPPGALNLVHGSGAVVGEALVAHPDVAAVSFTGSGPVGRRIHGLASERMARVQLEMGGKNPLVVLDDADPVRAATIAAAGGFGLTGQACTATSRLIVTPRILDAVVEELANLVIRRYLPGDGLDPDAQMGPVVSDGQLTSNLRYLELAKAEGGDVVTGAHAPQGLYQTPAIVTGVTSGHTLAREEVFGPVVAVMAVSDLEEAIAVANDVPFGLSAGVVTNDLRAAHRFAAEVAAGVVKVNRPTSGLDLNVPFGGVKESSTNTYREQGQGALDFYTWTKSVYVGID